jgi:hypothetical protein
MTCTIKWNTQSIEDWDAKFSRVPASNIHQSYSYAQTMRTLSKQKPKLGLIEIDGHEAGIVQMIESGVLWNSLHSMTIERGPLWFEGFGTALHVKRFFDELNRQYPRRFGRRRNIAPETQDGPTAQKLIAQTGLQFSAQGRETIWLDLTQDMKTLYRNLAPASREALSKTEHAGLLVDWDWTGRHLAQLIAYSKAHADLKEYSTDFVLIYGALLADKGCLLTGRAIKDNQTLSWVVFATHGRSASYLAGWSSEAAYGTGAHHLLLWDGACMLQERGIKELDLGGTTDARADNNQIRQGLGGRQGRTVGRYR